MFSLIRKPMATVEGKLREDLRLALAGWDEEQKDNAKMATRLNDLEALISQKIQEIDGLKGILEEKDQAIQNLKAQLEQERQFKTDSDKLATNTLRELTAANNRNEVLNSQVTSQKEKINKMEKVMESIVTQIEEAI